MYRTIVFSALVSAGIGLSACATAPSAQPATVAELTAQCEGLGGVLVPRQRDARRGGGDYVCRSGDSHARLAAGASGRRTGLNQATDQALRGGY